MHEDPKDDNRTIVELWKDLWLDISPGEAGIRMNLDAIIDILEKSINSSSWLLKTQSASSMNTIAKRLEKNLDLDKRIKLINLLLKHIFGSTFPGKEKYIEALASLNKNLPNSELELKIKIIDAAMREAKKEKPVYRTHALKSLGDILDESEIDRFEEVYNMVWYLLDKQELTQDDEVNSDMTADEKLKKVGIFIALKEAVCLTLGKAWPTNSIETQEKYQKMFVEKCVECLKSNTRPVQMSLLIALSKFLDRLKIFEYSGTENENQEKKPKIDESKQNEMENLCNDVLSTVTFVAGSLLLLSFIIFITN